MQNSHGDHSDSEARDILMLTGGAALIVLGAGLVMTHRTLRQGAKSALTALMPDLEKPLKAGVKGVLPDIERYLRLKGM
jgi:hypothetical protein